MAYTVITKPTLGDAVKKSLIDDLIDNSDYLYDNLGGGNLVENGSFEQGTSPADPTGWVSFKWGTGDIETTDPGHGKQGYKFTSTGAGGGYLTMSDFAECSQYVPLTISFLMKSSVADINNIVRILWYKKDQTACVTPSTDIYSNAATNPTSWTHYMLMATPPTDARYFKMRLIGADSSDATPGSCIFDGVDVSPSAVTSVVGYASTSNSSADAADRIHIAGSLSSSVIGSAAQEEFISLSGTRINIAGDGNVVVDLRDSVYSRLTVTLALPAGNWTIYASATWRRESGTPSSEHHLTAMAIREG